MESASLTLQNQIACRTCGQDHAHDSTRPGWVARCARCGSELEQRTHRSLHMTAAFALAALFLYAPANIFPILRMNLYGTTTDNTAWQGCVRLYEDGDLIVAIIVFLASILVPLLKLVGIFFLVLTTRWGSPRWRQGRTRIYRLIEILGRWAMLDVFVVAVLVSLVKLNGFADVLPGSGLFAFTGVVVFTLLASASFDPQLLWNPPRNEN